jgi:membrane fusion protein (multidrug efflux system)
MTLSRLTPVFIALALVACSRGGSDPATAVKPGQPQAAAPLLLGQEDVLTVGLSAYSRGPVISGSIQPEKRADLRAEIGAVVVQVLQDNSARVRRGDVLIRLDDTSLRDALVSAEEALRASNQSFEQAQRQLERLKTLHGQGMVSLQALEDAELRRNNAQSDFVAVKARVANARQQMQRTEIRAPFDGVVSERKVSVGDTVQPGRELIKVIDPASMRLEGFVAADRLQELRVGQAVAFRINGFENREFAGSVRRVDATANSSTRQVEVHVGFSSPGTPLVAGLYAEGRIEAASVQALMIPEATVVRSGDAAHVWRLRGSTINKVPVVLGGRDERRGVVEVRSPLAAGDQILRRPAGNWVDGQAVSWRGAAPAAPAASAAVPIKTGA